MSIEAEAIALAVPLIKKWEGYKEEAYICPAGKWTIGYGTTKGVKKGDRVDQIRAENLLRMDIKNDFLPAIYRHTSVPLNPNQLAAIISAVYNLGSIFVSPNNSTFLSLLNQGMYYHAAEQFHRWVHAGGRKLPGLKARRRAEKELFLTPYDDGREIWYPDNTRVEKLDVKYR